MKNTFLFGAIWDLFLEEYTACCEGFDIILKYDPKNDLLSNKCPKHRACAQKLPGTDRALGNIGNYGCFGVCENNSKRNRANFDFRSIHWALRVVNSKAPTLKHRANAQKLPGTDQARTEHGSRDGPGGSGISLL